MSPIRFTEPADPVVEAAIDEALRRIAEAAAEIPGTTSVLLGGSVGRGEGTPGEDGTLASDLEVYLVGQGSGMRRRAAALERRMAQTPGMPAVSVAWLDPERLRRGWAKNLSRRPSSTIQLYELATGVRVLAGSMPEVRPIDPERLPLAEGVRLILNRLAEATPLLAGNDADAGRWVDKVLIACGDTLLLAGAAYTVGYRDRASRLAAAAAPWSMPDGSSELILAAYERKLRGGRAGDSPARVASVVDAALRGALSRSPGIDVASWAGFPRAFVTAAARDEAFLRYLPPLGPPAVYEGLLLLLRVRRAGLGLAPRSLGAALRGRPLSLALQGAAAPLFLGLALDRPDLVAAAAAAMREAGIPDGPLGRAGSEPRDLAELLHRYWVSAA